MEIRSSYQNYNYSVYEPTLLGFEEEDPFFTSSQLHPFDFSGFSSFSCPWEFPFEDEILDAVPLMENLPTDLDPYPSMQIQNTPQVVGEIYNVWEDEFGSVVNEVGAETDKQIVLYENKGDNDEELLPKGKKVSRCKERKNNTSSSELSRDTISQYFYMPITKAAKELNVGLTLLKKRCRELGIPRWPHRKLMSLQTLIKNVQEVGTEVGESSDLKKREAIELLEQERKLMEEMPEVQLDERTKKLRQACFKANYKKRKLMGMLEWQPSLASDSAYIECSDALSSSSAY